MHTAVVLFLHVFPLLSMYPACRYIKYPLVQTHHYWSNWRPSRSGTVCPTYSLYPACTGSIQRWNSNWCKGENSLTMNSENSLLLGDETFARQRWCTSGRARARARPCCVSCCTTRAATSIVVAKAKLSCFHSRRTRCVKSSGRVGVDEVTKWIELVIVRAEEIEYKREQLFNYHDFKNPSHTKVHFILFFSIIHEYFLDNSGFSMRFHFCWSSICFSHEAEVSSIYYVPHSHFRAVCDREGATLEPNITPMHTVRSQYQSRDDITRLK